MKPSLLLAIACLGSSLAMTAQANEVNTESDATAASRVSMPSSARTIESPTVGANAVMSAHGTTRADHATATSDAHCADADTRQNPGPEHHSRNPQNRTKHTDGSSRTGSDTDPDKAQKMNWQSLLPGSIQ